MYLSVLSYYNELLLERSFKQVLAYSEMRSLKQTYKQRADRFYKNTILNRWV